MPLENAPSSVTYSSGASGPADLRLLHYNDVYHIEPGSREPVGGAARFVSLIRHYRSAPEFAGQPELLTFFSGDAFNPSLESSVTKGSHMVPIMNEIGTDVACLGNHDLDFGVEQLKHLTGKCDFPWLCANVEDPALGEGVSIAGLPKTVMFESSNGIKIGVIGLVEREWLDTINSLPPNLIYTSATTMAKKLVPGLREQGAEIIIAVSHQREPNDIKLAKQCPEGLIDIVLGGHDHHYAHEVINGCHVIRSGCDFKQLSYVEARRNGNGGWNFDITRRDITRECPKDEHTAEIVDKLTAGLKAKLSKPIGFTAVPLDVRFSTIRCKESNMANFVCDLMRFYYNTDCSLMAGGTVRGDQIYPPGIIKLGDIVNCFPFEDPVIVIRLPGTSIRKAIENGISKLPALEGRFPHVSGISFTYDPSLPSGSRVVSIKIGDEDLVPDKKYTLATRAYMAKGKDGYSALSSEGGSEEVVDEENGILISMILRQYFLSLKVVGKWSRGGAFRSFFGGLKRSMTSAGSLIQSNAAHQHEVDNDGDDSDSEDEDIAFDRSVVHGESVTQEDRILGLVKKAAIKWEMLVGVRQEASVEESHIDWTSAIAPKLENRITDLTAVTAL